MTCMSIDGLGKELPLVWLPQTIGPTLDRDLIYLGMVHQLIAYQPPEVLPALNVARNKEDGNRNLELLCKRKSMHIVIAVAIVKGQYQQCTLITSIFSILKRSIQFFKSLFKVKHTIVTTQVEQVMAKVSSTCAMVVQDNQAWPRAPCPPARKFHQPTIVETCSNEHSYLPTHMLLLHLLKLWSLLIPVITDSLTRDDGSPGHPLHEPLAFACQAPRGSDRYTTGPFGIGSYRAQGPNRWSLRQRPSHQRERYSRSCCWYRL